MGELKFCPSCGALLDVDILVRFRKCNFCGVDLSEILLRYYKQLYDPPSPFLKRQYSLTLTLLRSQLWEKAEAVADTILDEDPCNAFAFLFILMAQVHASEIVELADCKSSFESFSSYRMFRRFAPRLLLAEVDGYLETVLEREKYCKGPPEQGDFESVYISACDLLADAVTADDYEKASELFSDISFYGDSSEKFRHCIQMSKSLRAARFQRNLIFSFVFLFLFLISFLILAGFVSLVP